MREVLACDILLSGAKATKFGVRKGSSFYHFLYFSDPGLKTDNNVKGKQVIHSTTEVDLMMLNLMLELKLVKVIWYV